MDADTHDTVTGSNSSDGGQDQIDCEDQLTPEGGYPVIRQPGDGQDVNCELRRPHIVKNEVLTFMQLALSMMALAGLFVLRRSTLRQRYAIQAVLLRMVTLSNSSWQAHLPFATSKSTAGPARFT